MTAGAQSAWERFLATPDLAPLLAALILEHLDNPLHSQTILQLPPQAIAELYSRAFGNACILHGERAEDRSIPTLCRTTLVESGLIPSHLHHTRRPRCPPFVTHYAHRRYRMLHLHRSARRAEWKSKLFLLRSIMSRSSSGVLSPPSDRSQ